ncbi:MAG: glutamate synthase subunit beta [Eubacteriales bacterium]
MGKITGFLEYERKNNTCQSPESRIGNYNEFHPPLSVEDRMEQGARCMNCGVPFCQSAIELKGMVTGCPLHNLIPEWNDAIFGDIPLHGLARLLKTSSFPEFTGRVCPALCEKACISGMDGMDPVTIRENELFLIENGFANGVMQPRIPAVRSGKKVAVIGSGPAGLAVADKLNQRGHSVTVFERDDRAGGLLMYGIPNMKLEKHIVDRRVNLMTEEGIEFKTNANVGGNIPAADVMAEYDAVVLCCGAKQARDLSVPKRDVEGVHFAVDFLTSSIKSLLDEDMKEGTYISAKDKHVVVIGGGDTGNDCVGTSIRHGCKSITQIEMMPKAPDERAASNPWPEWPKVCKTDYGQEEAIAVFGQDPRVYETTVKELIEIDGKLTAVKTVQVKFEAGKLVEVEGSEQTIDADILLIAAGFTGCETYVKENFGVEMTPRNTIAGVDNTYQTTEDKVFTAGDVHRGQSLVVWAIAEGRACAKEVDKYLMGYTNM